jgi:hypothetical protein
VLRCYTQLALYQLQPTPASAACSVQQVSGAGRLETYKCPTCSNALSAHREAQSWGEQLSPESGRDSKAGKVKGSL